MPYVYHLGQLKNLWVFPTLMSPSSSQVLKNYFIELNFSEIPLKSHEKQFSLPAWEILSEFSFIPSNESSCLFPITLHTICSLFHWPGCSPPHSASTESVTLGRSLKVAIPSRVLLLTFSLRGSLLWGSFSKSVVLDAWAWCDWCRHLSPGVIVIAISVTVSAGFPLHYLKRALDVCNCSTVNNRYQKE